jgi:hypothetical protein
MALDVSALHGGSCVQDMSVKEADHGHPSRTGRSGRSLLAGRASSWTGRPSSSRSGRSRPASPGSWTQSRSSHRNGPSKSIGAWTTCGGNSRRSGELGPGRSAPPITLEPVPCSIPTTPMSRGLRRTRSASPSVGRRPQRGDRQAAVGDVRRSGRGRRAAAAGPRRQPRPAGGRRRGRGPGRCRRGRSPRTVRAAGTRRSARHPRAPQECDGGVMLAADRQAPDGDGGVVGPHRTAVVGERVEPTVGGGHGPQAEARSASWGWVSWAATSAASSASRMPVASRWPMLLAGPSTGWWSRSSATAGVAAVAVVDPERGMESGGEVVRPAAPGRPRGGRSGRAAPRRGGRRRRRSPGPRRARSVAGRAGRRRTGCRRGCPSTPGCRARGHWPSDREKPVVAAGDGPVDPVERGFHMGQQRFDLTDREAPPPGFVGKDDEQRGGVDGAVVVGR